MKVYSISRWAFYGICLLILILPVSRHWELLLRGRTATGTVGPYERHLMERRIGEEEVEMANTIEFESGGVTYATRGPWNYEYRTGRTVKVRYDPQDPQRNCILTFSGLYLNNYSILPLILITVWAAFYLSFNNYRKKRRPGRAETPAFSPYGSSARTGQQQGARNRYRKPGVGKDSRNIGRLKSLSSNRKS